MSSFSTVEGQNIRNRTVEVACQISNSSNILSDKGIPFQHLNVSHCLNNTVNISPVLPTIFAGTEKEIHWK